MKILKKFILVVFLGIFLFFACIKVQEKYIIKYNYENIKIDFDFRSSNWGDGKKQIKTSEGKPNICTKDIIVYYDIKLLNLNTDVVFLCTNNKLIDGYYLIKDYHSNKELYIQDYIKVENALKKKYGEPEKKAENWINLKFENDIGTALYNGDVVFASLYNRGNKGTILHTLKCNNYKVNHKLDYRSIEYENNLNLKYDYGI